MSVEEEIKGILEETKATIQANMSAQGINATGRTSLSLRVQKDGTKIMLIGGGDSSKWGGKTAPFESIEVGRAPGGDWKRLRPIIVKWTVDKNLPIRGADEKDEESKRWAISTVIAKNIVAKGTSRYSKPVDVYSTPVNDAAVKIRQITAKDMKTFLRDIVAGRVVDTNTNF